MSAEIATGQVAEPKLARPTGSFRVGINHLVIFLVLMGAWELGVRMGWLDTLTTPAPSAIVVSLVRIYFIQGNVWWHLYVTLVEALAGCLVGTVLAIALAIAAALYEPVRRYIKPYIVTLQVTPRVALTPIIIAWLGFGWSPKIAVAALICFFAPFVNTLTGMMTTDEEANEMFRSLGASKAQVFWKLQLPSSMPIIMAGIKTAISLALGGAIVGEFVSANQGMGLLIDRYTGALNMPSAFAVLLSLTAAGFIFYRAAEFADERIVFWRKPDRMALLSRQRAAQWKARGK